MKRNCLFGILSFLIISLMSVGYSQKLADGIYAKFTTKRGQILVKLYADEVPMTVANFVGLAEGNLHILDSINITKPFYDGLKFHRVISKANGDGNDFMIQGGDPMGNGSGDPGYKFYDEFVDTIRHNIPGRLSMANSGPNTNGSQFFITIVPTPWLDGRHTIFGQVINGQNIVNETLANDTIEKIEIIREGRKYSNSKWDASEVFMKGYSVNKAKEQEEIDRMNKIAAMSKDDYMKYSFEQALKLYPNAKQTESGLIYVIDKVGIGDKIQAGDKLKVHYTGKFLNGKIFDSSVKRGQPMEFTYKSQPMIPGFDEALSMLANGGKGTFVIPYFEAYGPMGRPGAIPPYSDLIFELQIVDVTK